MRLMNAVRSLLRWRWPFLFWPVKRYRDCVDTTQPDGDLARHLQASLHSLRLQRYAWAACRIDDEAQQRRDGLIVVDLGCERGWLKRFTPSHAHITWIGLDGDTSHPSLAASRYDDVIQCNFNEALPLQDACADMVVSLHVFEHLANPSFTVDEVARILKPDGVFLAGTPTGPAPIAAIRTAMLRARDRAGKNRHWGHLQKLSPAAWHRLCRESGLDVEFLTGSHLIRRTGARLENHRWWIRLNQLWGGLLPSLGQEAYLSGIKPPPGRTPKRRLLERLWLQLDWATPVIAMFAVCFILFSLLHRSDPFPFADEIAAHQDGNDVFYWCPLSQPSWAGDSLLVIEQPEAAFDAYAAYEQQGKDLHLIVRQEHLAMYANLPVPGGVRLAGEWREGDERFFVLSTESSEPPLRVNG